MNNDEDDDLEVLRQAALSSLLKKKNNSSNSNALFYNPSAKPNLISIEPVKEEYYDGENDEFSTEYVIAEGLSVSSSDVDEIVEEVIVSEDEGVEHSSEGEDAVSVASKDSFDEILNSIEEEVKDTKTGVKGNPPVKRRRDTDVSSHPDKSTRTSSSTRIRSRSPLPKRQYVRRGGNNSRNSPLRHNTRRSPPPLHRRSPDNRRDFPLSTRRRSRTRSPAETRRPRTRSPLGASPHSRSPFDDRRLRVPLSSGLGRKPRSRGSSPRKRSRTRSPIINRRQRSRSPLVRRRTRSPYRRRAIVENSRRQSRRSRSRSIDKTSSRHTSRSSDGNGDNMSPSSLGVDTVDVNGDNASGSSRRSQPSSPEHRKLSEVSKSNRLTKSDKEADRRAPTDRSRSAADRNHTRPESRPKDGERKNRRSSPHDSNSNRRRRSDSRSSTGKAKPKTRTPSPDLSNLSKEEREVFEKRKRKFQTSVNVSKLSGKIKLKSGNSENPDRRQQKTGGQTGSDKPRIKLSDKKSELSSRLGAVVVPEEESRSPEDTRITVAADSGEEYISQGPSSNSPPEEKDSKKSSHPPDEREDLRTKLQQKRATGMGRLFSVALQDTLSTSSASEDTHKREKSHKRNV